ncbi:MAG TPA: hypothetical protein VFY16_11640 [Gemmatimonadaceae bacterium]|nr:hypothetical protein [Gemmatimonadaceae bacterium]
MAPPFFPRTTQEWHLEEPAAFRRLSLSLLEMGALTGVGLRLYRALVLGVAGDAGWLMFGALFALGAAFLLGMATLHLGNFPVRAWLWRAPAFALVAALLEGVTSLALIATGHEPLGTGRATYGDWPGLVLSVIIARLLLVGVFAALLAGVVQLVRRLLLRHEQRDHTVRAVHEDHVRRTGEHAAQPDRSHR